MTIDTRDHENFKNQIENLDIQLSQGSDGVFTVCTTSEPFFCYDADSKEELAGLVVDTLVSYAKYFHHINDLGVKAEDTPIEQGILPIERTTPVARFKPIFDLAA